MVMWCHLADNACRIVSIITLLMRLKSGARGSAITRYPLRTIDVTFNCMTSYPQMS